MAMSVDETVLSVITKRRSVRAYKDIPIKKDDLDKILEAGRWAPSGVNIQPWRFLVVREKGLIKEIGELCYFGAIKSRHVCEAAVVIVLCGDSRSMGDTWEKDCMIAGTNITLMAEALGIGSCWIGAFNGEGIRTLCSIPGHLKIIAIISMGYAKHPVVPPPRLPLKDLVHYERLGSKDVPLLTKTTKSGPFSVLGRIAKVIFGMR
jgi:nitroreductase